MGDVAAQAESVYEQCLRGPPGHYFTTQELQGFLPSRINPDIYTNIINALLNDRKLQVFQQPGNVTVFRVNSREVLDKLKNMNGDEEMLYMIIKDTLREGIWSKQLKTKTNMHQTTLNKSLKSLEQKRYVKVIQSVKYPTRKIYMLYELSPSIEVSGGPWFTDGELDEEFITQLTTAIHKFISSKSLPPRAKSTTTATTPSSSSTTSSTTITSFSPDYTSYPTLNQIYLWVKNSDLTELELAEADIKSLLDVLVYDGKIERVVGGTAYKAARKVGTENGFTEAPCGRCPVFGLCREGGPVSASNCKYFEEWLGEAF